MVWSSGSSCWLAAYSLMFGPFIQKTSGAPPPAAAVWRVVKYCLNGVTWIFTVTFGFAVWNSSAIFCMAGAWFLSQMP